MGTTIQSVEIHKPGLLWWNENIILSFDTDIQKNYSEIKERFIEISKELNEFDNFISLTVSSVKDFYYKEFENTIMDPKSKLLTEDEKDLIESLFERFCKNYGIFTTGFVISFYYYTNNYNNTINKIKDEIIHNDPKY